jgi:DNA-3-methyladenine glycosylase II
MPLFHFSAPLDFSATLRYIGRFENDTLHAVRDDAYYHVLSDARGYFLVEVKAAKTQTLQVTIVKGTTNSVREKLLAHFVERTFGPDEILNAFYKQRGKDVEIKRLTRKFRGVRLVGIVNLWDCMSWSVIGQQVSVYSAFATRSRLTQLCGAQVRWNGDIYEGFPTPSAFLKLSSEAMRAAGLSRQKAGYLTGIAQQFVSGQLNENELCAAPPEHMRAALLALKGIGPWSADYAMMRMHRDPDACPFEDIGVRDAVAHEYGLTEQASIEQVKTISENWRPFRAYTTFYLWQTLLKKKTRSKDQG